MNELRYEKKEIVKLIILNNKNEIQKILNVAIGGSNFANFCVTEILGEAVKNESTKNYFNT